MVSDGWLVLNGWMDRWMNGFRSMDGLMDVWSGVVVDGWMD